MVNGPFSKFVGIEVDGVEAVANSCETESGSTMITLEPAYLNKLAIGKHTVVLRYTDGEASGTFTIREKSNVPVTGDDSNIGLWASMLCLSALAVLLADNKRKKYAK